MKLTAKHQQQTVTRKDFTGGLNTTSVPELIKDNQLAECINMELNRNTGALQTCCGTAMLFKTPPGVRADSLFFDEINNVYLLCDEQTRKVYKTRLVDMKGVEPSDCVCLGDLSGDGKPMAAMWEDGLLVASGGELQYWDGTEFYAIVPDLTKDGTDRWAKRNSAGDWAVDKAYLKDKVVLHNGKYYRSLESHVSGLIFDDSLWRELVYREDGWNINTEYKANELLTYHDNLYECVKDHTSGGETPKVCNGVFIKDGRVYIWHDYRLECSGVGDERMWTDDSNDDSSAKWIDVGYKEGEGKKAYILGVCALSSDIIVLKYDGKVYRLSGVYPNWSLKEIARNIQCINERSYVAVQNGVFAVTRSGMFYLQTTADYGDIEPQNVAANITGIFSYLSTDSITCFLPILNQVWITGTSNTAIIYDLSYNAFFMREFNKPVTGIARNRSDVLLCRGDSVTQLDKGGYGDCRYSEDETPLRWKFAAKSHTSFHDFLLKRMRIAYVPLMDDFGDADIITGQGKISMRLADTEQDSPTIENDTTLIAQDNALIYPLKNQFNTSWMVYRDRTLDLGGAGLGSAVIINEIEAAITEV